MTTTVQRPRGRSAALLEVGLAVVALAALVVRIPSAAEPLGIDQGLFASAALAIDRGLGLYRDVWDQKPPAIFLTYLAAFRTFGWTSASIAWLDLVASAGTTLLVAAIARRFGTRRLALGAAALFAALTIPAWLYRYGGFLERSVAETFQCVCFGAAAWCAAGLRERPRAWMPLSAGFGVACGAAVAFKPNAAVYFVTLLGWIWVYRDRRVPMPATIVTAVAGAAIAPLLSFVWLWQHGLLPDARVAIVEFNRFYVANSASWGQVLLDFSKAVWLRFKTDPLWASAGIGVLVSAWLLFRERCLEPLPAMAAAWGAAAAIAIAANRYLFNTYFIQALPALALLSAWTIGGLWSRRTVRRAGAVAAMAALLIFAGRKNYPVKVFDVTMTDLRAWRGDGDRNAYLERFGGYGTGGGYSARANSEVADYVRAHTGPDDRIYQFGINSAVVYFAADRLMAERFLRVNEFVPATFPSPGFNLRAVAETLAARRPAYLIFEQLHGDSDMAQAVDRLESAPELQPLLAAYEREAQIEDYAVWRRQ